MVFFLYKFGVNEVAKRGFQKTGYEKKGVVKRS